MPLIKDNNAQRMQHEAVVLDLGDLQAVGERMKAEAKAEAARIIAEAQAEAQRLSDGAAERGHAEGFEQGKAAGFTQGRAEGHAQALAEAQEQLATLQQAWVNAAQQWDADRRQMLLDARQSLLALALDVAGKVVHRVPRVDPSVVVDQVAAAVEHMARPADATIRVHPDDRALVAEALPQLVEQCNKLEHAHLADDETLTPGGCVVTYGNGAIDATLETQLKRIVETLLPVDATPSPEPRDPEPDNPKPDNPEPGA